MYKKTTLTIMITIIIITNTPTSIEEDRTVAAASIETFSLIAKEIGGTHITVYTILPEEIEPHAFQLTPQIITMIRKTSLLILTGHFQFENEILQVVNTPYISLEDYKQNNLKLLTIPDNGVNPHGYWLHPKNALAIAKTIMKKLQEIDPKHGDYYLENFNKFEEKITKLLNHLNENIIEVFGLKWIKAVIAFPAAQYVTATLQIKSEAFLSKGHGVLVSASKLIEIEEKLRSGEYKLIVSPDIVIKTNLGDYVKQIAEDTNTPVAFIKTISGENFSSYTELTMYNVGVIIGAITNKQEASSTKTGLFTPLEVSLIILVLILSIIASIEAWLLMGRI